MAEIYDEEAVQQILQIAIARQSSKAELSRSQLVEIAEDLGISLGDLQAAEQQWQIQKQTQQEHQAFHDYQHERLRQSAVKYLIVNTFLLLINAWINQTLSWSVPIALIWGLFLALQAWQTFHPEGQSYEKAFHRWRLRQQVGQSLKTFSEKLKELATAPKGTT
ncbi:MAG: 2TM domain-containing protein [Elainellaceae cyanobacterium]